MLKGKIKWFSVDKGYGFIFGNDGKDRFFHVSDVVGGELPNNGDLVEFDEISGKKGPQAKLVTIAASDKGVTGGVVSGSRPPKSERPTCSGCGKSMTPRVVTGPPLFSGRRWTPTPLYSVCPFCGVKHQTFTREVDYWSLLSGIGGFILFLVIAVNYIS